MPIPCRQLFESDHPNLKHAIDWRREIFARAYVHPLPAGVTASARARSGVQRTGRFTDVIDRLRSDFSVLVYLPGNCMGAAAELVQQLLNDGQAWIEVGRPQGSQQTTAEIWRRSTGLWDAIRPLLSRDDVNPPRAIFYNLDLLPDGQDGAFHADETRTALFYLHDAARNGVVLGLSDRDAGEVPEGIRRAFSDTVRLDEIPIERFVSLIPQRLGHLLADEPGGADGEGDAEIADGTVWMLASRLRWIDPIRAVRIMEAVADQVANEDEASRSRSTVRERVFSEIERRTRAIEFRAPSPMTAAATAPSRLDGALDDPPPSHWPKGFEAQTIELVEQQIIAPYRAWKRFSGDVAACEQALLALPPGLILSGPPGTGKTRLARWIAEQIGLPIRLVGASDLKRANYGDTERLVKELFRSALRAAPCVIVLDDADDILPDRNLPGGSVAAAERGIVNAFLQGFEGFHESERPSGVLVILTTNVPKRIDAAARQRMRLHVRVPFPTTKRQVKEIVSALAASFGIDVSKQLDVLTERFFDPLGTMANAEMVDVRRNVDEGLYSARQIEGALRLLVGCVVSRGGSRVVEPADVAAMDAFLKRLAAV